AVLPVNAFGRVNYCAAIYCDDGYGFRRVIKGRIEVGDVVSLREGRPPVLIAHAHLQAQPPTNFPAVGDEGFDLREAEESDRVNRRLRVIAKVAEQRVGKGIVRRVRVAASTERDDTCVTRTPVLVFAVADQ